MALAAKRLVNQEFLVEVRETRSGKLVVKCLTPNYNIHYLDAIQALFSAILATSRSFVEGYDLFKTIKKSTVSKRVSVSLPDLTHEKLQRWADVEGTSLADLAAYLLRRDVEQAEKEGKLNYPNEKK